MRIRLIWTILLLVAFVLNLGTAFAQWRHEENIYFVKFALDWQCNSLARSGDYLFVESDPHFISLDISDPANPFPLDSLFWGDDRHDFANDMAVSYPYLFAATTWKGVFVIDVTDPSNMRLLDTIHIANGQQLRTIQVWKNLLLTASEDSMYIYDISDPLHSRFNSKIAIDGAINNGQRAPLFISNDTIFFDRRDTLRMALLDTGHGIIGRKSLNVVSFIDQIIRYNSYLFLNRLGFLEIYKLGAAGNLQLLNSIESDLYVVEMQIHDNLLYLVGGLGSTIWVYDITYPENPRRTGVFWDTSWGLFYNIEVNGEYIYVASGGLLPVLKLDFTTPIQSFDPAPSSLSLVPAFPNPFSGSTSISYSLSTQEHITLELYNMLGQKVQTLDNGLREPGSHTARLDASALPAGTYRVALRSGSGVKSQMVVMRK